MEKESYSPGFLDRMLGRGLIPDFLIRIGIRNLNRTRLREEWKGSADAQQAHFQAFREELERSPIAVKTDAANEQHYEVPAAFYDYVLGARKKYSSCLWEGGIRDLDGAEEAMLARYLRSAELKDGQSILELGCGWGSLTLYMAEKLPKAKITAVSNSASQKQYIESRARKLGLKNIKIITADMNDFKIRSTFDRIVSIEMFEHMRNYRELFARVHGWLKKDGKLFLHVFAHREYSYFFEEEGESNWMGRYFFSGGIMPSNHLYLYFADGFQLEEHQVVNGKNYEKTSRAWLDNMDRHKKEIMEIFNGVYGSDQASKWFEYWRVFFMACEELFATRGGNEWYVSHYRFRKI
jgi:cyclopropane-fatty-acyl-phospholipid synthase